MVLSQYHEVCLRFYWQGMGGRSQTLKTAFELVSTLSVPFTSCKKILVILKQNRKISHDTNILIKKHNFPPLRGYCRESILWENRKSHLPIYWVKLEILLDCHLWGRITLIYTKSSFLAPHKALKYCKRAIPPMDKDQMSDLNRILLLPV